MALFQAVKRTGIIMTVLLVCMASTGSAKTPGTHRLSELYNRIQLDMYNPVAMLVAITWFDIVNDLPVPIRETGRTLYQAYESVTFEPGFESENGAEFVAEIVSGHSTVQAPSNNAVTPNGNMNWTIARTYDPRGKVLTDEKKFFDGKGQMLQSQSKVKYRKDGNTVYNHVFASQPIPDAQGRSALNTLAAPIDHSEFSYKPDFVQNTNGVPYDYRSFDRFGTEFSETDKTNDPDWVGGQNTKGTLGWYYGANNSWEPYTPTTNFPYTRQTFYRDGTSNVKKVADAGEVFRSGSGHEVRNYNVPVNKELDHYLQVRNKFFSSGEMGLVPTTLQAGAVQQVTRDANGKQIVQIKDRKGATLMTARAGNELSVNNVVTVAPGAVYYFRVFGSVSISISSASNELFNMDTETEQFVNIGTGGTIAAGYYKLVNSGVAPLTLNYPTGYADVSYLFYNQLGQPVAAIAPEGVKKLYGTGIDNYATKAAVPFITLYEYNTQGRLIKTTNPDGGSTEFVYRNDGRIRFSQNAEQQPAGRFSYTNYDVLGRPIETGEYKPEAGGIAFTSDMSVSSPMKSILENTSSNGGLTNGTQTNVVVTKYDVPDQTWGMCCYTQNQFYLRGSISSTRKYSSVVNNVYNTNNLVSATWYNYDAEGRVVWTIHSIAGFGEKATEYTFDVAGRLIKKIFQKNTSDETFVHYYEYDLETHKLSKVYTNTADNESSKKLQATYLYYLHGPLKRIVLATDLQGIDYTYTLKGPVKAVNNSNNAKDPGLDGNNGVAADAFGMVLDYFPGDYSNSRSSGIQDIKGVNTSTIGTDSYAGKIKAMTWFSRKPASIVASTPGIENPVTSVYQYDDKYQFTESTWGTGIDFNQTPAGFTSTGLNKETIKHPGNGSPGYDANGNILYLQRYNTTGALEDRFTYNYLNNTNKLQSVTDDATGTPQTYATYTYDNRGQLTIENNGSVSKYIKYDVSGKVIMVARDPGFTQPVVEYVYNEVGARIAKKLYNASFNLSQETFYVGDATYTFSVTNGVRSNTSAKEYQVQGGTGRLGLYYRLNDIYAYEMSDHLGNVRAVIAKNGSTMEVRMYSDYYPFGMVLRQGGTNDYRYDYQGQYAEKDNETNWNAFELRMYDSKIARWLAMDPKGQYASPYMGIGNDPVNGVDKDGGFWEEFRNWARYNVWMSDEAYTKYRSLKSEGATDIKTEWIGGRLKGKMKMTWNQNTSGFVQTDKDTYLFVINTPTAHAKNFKAKQDYFFRTNTNKVFAFYYDLEMSLKAGVEWSPKGFSGVNINIISYDLMKYSWAEGKFAHVFNLDDNMKDLKFSSSASVGDVLWGGSIGGSYAPGQGFELSASAKFLGIDFEVAQNMMEKEAATVMGFGFSNGISQFLGIDSKFSFKTVFIPNNDVTAWLNQ